MKSAPTFCLALLCLSLAVPTFAQSGTIVFNNVPSPTPGNVVSQGFQCCATAEIGDLIRLEADTPRRAGYATVLMSSWALRSTYPTMSAVGYEHPITLAIYPDAAAALAHTPSATITQVFTIPWRPEADPTCTGTAWRFDATTCFNGLAFKITFDLRGLNLTLPDEIIYGVAFNTNTWGYAPLHAAGPYESLNVGLTGESPSVGVDINSDVVFWNTSHGPFYSDGGIGGTGTFRPDSGWTGYVPTVTFTTFAIPATTSECKNGAWENLVRADFTSFRNQGACVSYVNTGQ